jgi:hypothetical protein
MSLNNLSNFIVSTIILTAKMSVQPAGLFFPQVYREIEIASRLIPCYSPVFPVLLI